MKSLTCLSVVFTMLLITTPGTAAEPEFLFFADLWSGFQTEDELLTAKQEAPEAKETLEKAGIYYYLQASGLPKGAKQRKPMIDESVSMFTTLWKQDRQDIPNMIRLGYALMLLCDTDIPLEGIIKNITRANGLFSTVTGTVPQNMDARLGRIYININLTPETGRPDEVLLDDAMVYLAGYESLLPETQQRPDIQMGLMVARLAAAIVWDARNEESNVLEHLQFIDPAGLAAAGLTGKYEKLAQKYGV